MKLVYNACFAGFGLSAKAVRAIAKRKGAARIWEYRYTLGSESAGVDMMIKADGRRKKNGLFVVFAKKDMGDGPFQRDEPADGGVIDYGGLSRVDSDLAAVVGEMGASASGVCSELRVLDIPNGAHYAIDEHDGFESVYWSASPIHKAN